MRLLAGAAVLVTLLLAPARDSSGAQTSVTFPMPPPLQAPPTRAAPKATTDTARPPSKAASPQKGQAVAEGKTGAPGTTAAAPSPPAALGASKGPDAKPTVAPKPAQPAAQPAAQPPAKQPAQPAASKQPSSKPATVPAMPAAVPPRETPPPAPAKPATASGAASAVVLQYHRFGDSKHPTTNVTVAQFDAHLAELARGGFKVMRLSDIVTALRDGKPLPDRAVAITIDDAYRSFLESGWPKLRSAGHPATLFVATDGVERKLAGLLTWDEIKAMQAQGLEVASHGHAHISYATATAPDLTFDLAASAKLFRERMGAVPQLFAFPYGEASKAAIEQIRAAGFVAAFGQQSGAIGTGSDMHFLPRFPFNEQFASIERFKLAASTLPLPLADVAPQDLLHRGGSLVQRFTLPIDLPRAKDLSCYHEGTRLALRTEATGARLAVQAPVTGPLGKGRQRINCTLPGPGGRWMWWGTQYLVP